jgi:hypothetical protein
MDGEFALYVGPFDKTDAESGFKAFGLLMDSGGKDELPKLLEKVKKHLAENKELKAATEKHKGISIQMFETGSDHLCMANVESVYIVMTDLAQAKRMIDHMTGEMKNPLAEHTAYKSIRDRAGKGDFFAYLNTAVARQFVNMMVQSMSKEEQEPFEKIVRATGLLSVHGVGAGLSLEKEGLKLDGFVHLDGYQGFMKAVAANAELDFSAVPKEASCGWAGHADMEAVGKLVGMLIKMAEAMPSKGSGEWKMNVKDVLGVDPKEDILDCLANDGSGFVSYAKPYTENSAQMAGSWKLKDAKKFEKTLESLALMGQKPKVEEVGAVKIYTMPVPDGDGSKALQKFSAYGVIGERVYFGDAESLKRLAKTPPAAGWKDREDIKPLLAMVPAKAIAASVTTSENMEYALAMAKAGKLADQFSLPLPFLINVGDIEKLVGEAGKDIPTPEAIHRYFQGGVIYAVAEEPGISVTGWWLFRNSTK